MEAGEKFSPAEKKDAEGRGGDGRHPGGQAVDPIQQVQGITRTDHIEDGQRNRQGGNGRNIDPGAECDEQEGGRDLHEKAMMRLHPPDVVDRAQGQHHQGAGQNGQQLIPQTDLCQAAPENAGQNGQQESGEDGHPTQTGRGPAVYLQMTPRHVDGPDPPGQTLDGRHHGKGCQKRDDQRNKIYEHLPSPHDR
jgi:hypothetical protein